MIQRFDYDLFIYSSIEFIHIQFDFDYGDYTLYNYDKYELPAVIITHLLMS